MKYDRNNNSGLGVLGVLQVIFIVLKILNVINWSWWKVFIPLYISIGIKGTILGILFIPYIINALKYKIKYGSNSKYKRKKKSKYKIYENYSDKEFNLSSDDYFDERSTEKKLEELNLLEDKLKTIDENKKLLNNIKEKIQTQSSKEKYTLEYLVNQLEINEYLSPKEKKEKLLEILDKINENNNYEYNKKEPFQKIKN